MTVEMQAQDAEVFSDITVEWRLLNKLLLPNNRDYINRLSHMLFTGVRAEVFRAMQLTFAEYGVISYEGIHKHMSGNVPGQLTAANQGDLVALIDQAARLATKRMLRQKAISMEQLSKEYSPDMDSAIDLLTFEPIMATEDSSIGIGAQSFLGDLHAKRNGEYVFARTGFKFLDRNMGGEWKPKGFVVIAGGVGSGKTTLWLNTQKAMAKGYVNQATGEIIHTASLFISLEMGKADLIMKMVADELEIDSGDILSGNLEPDQIDAIERKVVEIQQLPMYVIDNGRLTLPQMVYEIRRHILKYNVRVVAIDYLQLINHHPTGNANNDLGDVAEILKDLAKRENITIIVLSQINRSGEGYNAIRDSGEVQAVADVIMELIPDDEEGFTNAGPLRGVNIGWWKNRYGAAGRKTPVLLNGPYQRFEANV